VKYHSIFDIINNAKIFNCSRHQKIIIVATYTQFHDVIIYF